MLAPLPAMNYGRRRHVARHLKRASPQLWAGVWETYTWAEEEYCEKCIACMTIDTNGKPYTKFWAHSWPMTVGYLLKTNLSRDVWKVLPPSVRAQ